MIPTCRTEDEFAFIAAHLMHCVSTGVLIEIGVYNGATAKFLRERMPNREIHLYDTFLGILGDQAEPGWNAGDYRATLSEVKQFIGDDYIFHEGDVCTQTLPDKIAFAHIDLDVYTPLASVLPRLWIALTPGGVALIVNFDQAHLGVQKAIDEFCVSHPQIIGQVYGRYFVIRKQ